MTEPFPGPNQPQQPPYGPGYPQPPVARPLYKMKRVYAGGLFLLLVGTGCGGAMSSGDSGDAKGSAGRPGLTVTATVTATATATVTAKPAAPAKASPTKQPAAAPAVETATLPNFVGMNHQDAQDTAQAIVAKLTGGVGQLAAPWTAFRAQGVATMVEATSGFKDRATTR